MITAILKMGILNGKMRLVKPTEEIRIPVVEALTISFLQEAYVPNSPNRHKVLVFEWKRQTKKYTHEYLLKRIDL